MKISINNKTFDCEVADTEELRSLGLQYREVISPMVFIFDKPEFVSFHMHNVRLPIDMIFVDESKKVLKRYSAYPEEEKIDCNNVKYVIETPLDYCKVKSGDLVVMNEKIAKIANEIMKEAESLKQWQKRREEAAVLLKKLEKSLALSTKTEKYEEVPAKVISLYNKEGKM